ncbi:UPF0183-domain-containing protein [Peniophora sp. CONT]|nr:UPF0183-domain-containing protein [Peniophora sp. CONT]
MFSDLELDLRPGTGAGAFSIGQSLWNVLDYLRQRSQLFNQVDVKYDPDATASPVVVHVRPHLDLLFSPAHQRLHTIAIRQLQDSPPLTIGYKGAVLSAPGAEFRRKDASIAFGPTYEGDDLRYPGVRFCFAGDNATSPTAPSGQGDREQRVQRILVTQADADPNAGPRDPLSEVLPCTAMDGELAEAVVRVHDGVTMRFWPDLKDAIRIRIGVTTAQDLVLDLGEPLRTFYKEDDRMSIHARERGDDNAAEPAYFYNYFQYGVDFLISDSTHIVKKIILHTNVPGSPLFQRYKRCPWQIEGKPEDDEDDSPPRVKFTDRMDTISRFLSPGGAPTSMNYDRTNGDDALTLPAPTTRLLGFDGIILEATQAAQVVSVTLF